MAIRYQALTTVRGWSANQNRIRNSSYHRVLGHVSDPLRPFNGSSSIESYARFLYQPISLRSDHVIHDISLTESVISLKGHVTTDFFDETSQTCR
ncbi:hypothetical protein ACU8KH_05639 [Lachancea thermotolerans]